MGKRCHMRECAQTRKKHGMGNRFCIVHTPFFSCRGKAFTRNMNEKKKLAWRLGTDEKDENNLTIPI